ncbi:unnamed protein product [Thelazia callipaeda]|uniref:NUMOD4 domain-containing protein n=1 Tax=Thelazia callipaeda TaxID=103827 RepID=A0A0N5D723_THECL|nr:unnamed protein product [Thelazia callipaeda]
MKRSVTDKWITRDENGSIMSECLTKSWTGKRDKLLRRNDGAGEAWHREVNISPEGSKTFLDHKRYYTRDYVIESQYSAVFFLLSLFCIHPLQSETRNA